MERNRAFFFEELRKAQEQANLSAEEADAVVQEALHAIRSAKLRRELLSVDRQGASRDDSDI
jgi:hypothetical protein